MAEPTLAQFIQNEPGEGRGLQASLQPPSLNVPLKNADPRSQAPGLQANAHCKCPLQTTWLRNPPTANQLAAQPPPLQTTWLRNPPTANDHCKLPGCATPTPGLNETLCVAS